MSTKLRAYVEELFANAPTTPRIYELKEELLANAEEKYADLLAAGSSEEDAYAGVVAGMGDTEELIASLAAEPAPDPYPDERARTAQVVATSTFLYCLAIAAFLLLRMIFGNTLAWVAFWVIAGFASAQTVYHYMTRPAAVGYAQLSPKRRKHLRHSISSILWLLTTILYFVISFSFHNWALSWLIFLVSAILEQVLSLIFPKGDD